MIVFEKIRWKNFLATGDHFTEIELDSEEEEFEVPPWVGVEVSDDLRYYTANLVHHPYARWEDI